MRRARYSLVSHSLRKATIHRPTAWPSAPVSGLPFRSFAQRKRGGGTLQTLTAPCRTTGC